MRTTRLARGAVMAERTSRPGIAAVAIMATAVTTATAAITAAAITAATGTGASTVRALASGGFCQCFLLSTQPIGGAAFRTTTRTMRTTRGIPITTAT